MEEGKPTPLGPPVTVDYTNWRGVRDVRRVQPVSFAHGSNQYHTDGGYLLGAVDLAKPEKGVLTFSMDTIHAWGEAAVDARATELAAIDKAKSLLSESQDPFAREALLALAGLGSPVRRAD